MNPTDALLGISRRDLLARTGTGLGMLGLAGLEHVVGIPGRLGGLVVMNGGSQRKGIGAHVARVTVVRPDGTTGQVDRAGLDFHYRRSALQGSGAIVTEVVLQLPLAQGAA